MVMKRSRALQSSITSSKGEDSRDWEKAHFSVVI